MIGWANAATRTVGRALATGRDAVRTASPLDSNPVPADWQHVTKVDPEPGKPLPVAYPLFLARTDAVAVGGSADVTAERSEQTLERLAAVPDLPLVQEPSGADHVTPETRALADELAVPEVLNGDSEALVGTLGTGIEALREEIAPELLDDALPAFVPDRYRSQLAAFATARLLDRALFEAYIVQNPDSAAAREAGVTEVDVLAPRAVKRRALAAETHLRSEIVYVEYSGTYGGDDALAALRLLDDTLDWSRCWYGGGLRSREQVADVLAAGADAVVVGDVFHEIAGEERRLAAAVDSGESAGAVVADHDLRDGPTVGYLSTVPTVSDPEAVAQRALTAGVRLRRAAGKLVADRRIESTADVRSAVAERWGDEPPGYDAFEAEFGREGRPIAQSVVEALVADLVGVPSPSEIPVGGFDGDSVVDRNQDL